MRYYNGSIANLTYRLRKFKDVLEESLQEIITELEPEIVSLVAEEQLYERGITGKGTPIMNYAPYKHSTIKQKIRKGQPTNRVTLRDTGAFHKSFFVEFDEGGFYVRAADIKTDKLILKYGEEIFRLTNENLNYLLHTYVRPRLAERLKAKLDL